MPLVSKRKLSKNIEERMFETLWEAISKLNSKQDIQSFLADLLSPVEIQMIAKRMAIAALLARGYGYESIQDIIKVSDATVAKVSRALNNNPGYKIAINKIARSEATREFWHDIENLVYRLSSPGKVFMPEGAIKHKLGHKKKTLV